MRHLYPIRRGLATRRTRSAIEISRVHAALFQVEPVEDLPRAPGELQHAPEPLLEDPLRRRRREHLGGARVVPSRELLEPELEVRACLLERGADPLRVPGIDRVRHEHRVRGGHDLRLDVLAVLPDGKALVLLGQVLELKARSRTGSAIRALMGLAPKTARRIREIPGLSPLPKIIMATAYGCEEAAQLARSGGLDGYLTKPSNLSVLFDVIMCAFGRENPDYSGSSREKG